MSTKDSLTHTPGPWELRNKSRMAWGQERIAYDLGGANNRIVALLSFGDFTPGSVSADTSRQDARLIAAAPELLAAAEIALRFIDTLCVMSTLNHSKVCQMQTYKDIQQIVNRARGEL